MSRILITVAYDGTQFHGWQLQPECRTVEGVLNEVLSSVLKEPIEVIGASRTDAGVHAYGNVAIFDTEMTIPPEKLPLAINRFLPEDVKIREAREVADDFHPRKCESRKTYEYRIYSSFAPMPSFRRTSYYTYLSLDEKAMDEAAKLLVGEHDFRSFCCVHTQAESTVRTIIDAAVTREQEFVIIRVTGTGFLYNMVRIIAGTLMDVGSCKVKPAEITRILEARDRAAAGFTAPPEGLTLVKYENVELCK